MPYKSIDDLPKNVRNPLPKHAQEIYKSAYNSAYEQHKSESDKEERAAKIAWSAVKEKYEKGDDDKWHKKD
ncbi:cation transport regulator [Microbulbifer sp. SH-1]|nr:cation transport regulator [Microbulbifer sp. SH-1]